MKGRNIVVTGGCGFIGSTLVDELSKNNEVTVVDNLSTGKKENIKGIDATFIRGSITDLKLLNKTFRDVDYVFHQAAVPSVLKSVRDPVKSNDTNINGTLNVLVAARDHNVKKVIYASSSSVYGDAPILPKSEALKPSPLSPYAVSKLAGEYYCQVFTEIYGLSTVSLRYFNVYGPHQDPSSEYAAVIPKFITRILNDEPPIIYGDGLQTRDFTFVKDVVNANILAAKSNTSGVFNIASGKRISINELARLIMDIIGKDLGVKYDEPRSGDIKHSLADISKAHDSFGYSPKFDLKQSLKESIQWFQTQH